MAVESTITHLENLCSFLEPFATRPIPTRLYRIQHGGSQAYLEDGNLKARSNLVPENIEELCHVLDEHLKWTRSKVDSCFISVFDDPWCALAWGEHRARQRRADEADAVLYEIDTGCLGTGLASMMFHVDSLLTSLGLRRPTLLKGQEYLILLGVPAKAIRYSHNISNPALGAGIAKQIDLEPCQHRPTHDATHRQICLTCASETALQRHLLESRKKVAAERQIATSSCATKSRVTFALNDNGHQNGGLNGNGTSHDVGMSNGDGDGVQHDLTNGFINGMSHSPLDGMMFSNGNASLQTFHCDPDTGWLAP